MSAADDASGSAERSQVVTERDTAAVWGEVFPAAASTPFVLGLAEVACHDVVADELPPDHLTVGTGATIEHRAPSPVGTTLTARATLTERSGSRLRFDVVVSDGHRDVASISHTRAIVARSKILELLG